jgi:hypothetical protein
MARPERVAKDSEPSRHEQKLQKRSANPRKQRSIGLSCSSRRVTIMPSRLVESAASDPSSLLEAVTMRSWGKRERLCRPRAKAWIMDAATGSPNLSIGVPNSGTIESRYRRRRGAGGAAAAVGAMCGTGNASSSGSVAAVVLVEFAAFSASLSSTFWLRRMSACTMSFVFLPTTEHAVRGVRPAAQRSAVGSWCRVRVHGAGRNAART